MVRISATLSDTCSICPFQNYSTGDCSIRYLKRGFAHHIEKANKEKEVATQQTESHRNILSDFNGFFLVYIRVKKNL
jgi:hypothetical protein